jgi:SAM-dependent methyltransferase
MPMSKAIEATWDPIWEEIFRSKGWGKYPPEHVVRFVARAFSGVRDRSSIRLLEIGCGPGANIWFMAREGYSVCGIDGSATAIARARQRLTDEGLMADLQIGDYAQLPWPDSTFDGAIENVSLYCNPSAAIELALNEVHRVLRPGGPFLSSFFSDRTWGYGTGNMIERDGFVNLREGPLAGAGFCLFLNRGRVSKVFHAFTDLAVERVSWTLNNEEHLVEQIVITCRKEVSDNRTTT